MNRKRLFFDVFLFIITFIAPWWFVVFVTLIGVHLFTDYYEFLFVSLFIYALYLYNLPQMICAPVVFTIIVFLIFLILQEIKHFIILYKNKN